MIEGQRILAERAEVDLARFRGEFLAHCARIEDHAAEAIARLVRLEVLKKPPHLFGLKFKAVCDHVAHAKLWRQPAHVETVLDRLAGPVALRGAICHALMTPAIVDGRPGLTWRLPGDRDWQNRKSMTNEEQDSLLSDLKRDTDSFLRQEFQQA